MDSSFDQIILYSILILRILWLFQLSSAISIISWFSHPRENLMEILIRLLYFQKKMRIFGSSSSSIRLWLISILIYRMAGCSSCPPQFFHFMLFFACFLFHFSSWWRGKKIKIGVANITSQLSWILILDKYLLCSSKTQIQCLYKEFLFQLLRPAQLGELPRS